MKTQLKLFIILTFSFLLVIPLLAQTNSGIIKMTDNEWIYESGDDQYYKTYTLNVSPNTPIKINYSVYSYENLDIYTADNGLYRSYVSSGEPTSGTKTIISLTGKIYITLQWGWDMMGTGNTIFESNYSIDPNYTISAKPTIIQNDQFVTGKVEVGTKLAVGTVTNDNFKVYIRNTTDNYSIYNTSYKNTSSDIYGFYSAAGNTLGKVYGIYSTVYGLKGKKWAGFFNGGDVAIMEGNIGIGTPTPKAKIESVSGINSLPATTGNVQTGAALRLRGGDNAVLDFGVNSVNTWIQATDQTALGFNYNISLNPNGGNVGIGTKIPSSKLDVAAVNGEGVRIGKIGDTGNLTVPVGALSNQYNIDFTGYRDVSQDQIGARISALRFNRHLPNSALIQKTGLAFYTNPLGDKTGTADLLERMRITPEGRIGIGTPAPDEMLTVNGTIHAKEVRVDLTGSLADYVFKPTYKLMPLHEVEQYVKTNSHLPEIPSAAEVQKNGLSIGEMQNKLLQKIEELTLYVIEQQKEINLLKQGQK